MNQASIEQAFINIVNVPLEDGVTMSLTKIEPIRDEATYNGFRLSIHAQMEQVRLPLKVDLTTGDAITPHKIEYAYKLFLEERNIDILAYPIETVLAEKLETMLTRGLANTRLRDFYDIYALMETQQERLKSTELRKALDSTSAHRKSENILKTGDMILAEIFNDDHMSQLWKRYQKQYPYAATVAWEDVEKAVLRLWKMSH